MDREVGEPDVRHASAALDVQKRSISQRLSDMAGLQLSHILDVPIRIELL